MANYLDNNGVLYLWNKITARFVAKVEGKGLSTNDLTDELLQMINDSGGSSFDGAYGSLTGKPQINGVELTGNKSLTDIGVTAAITAAIADISGITFQILESGEYDPETKAPTITGQAGVFYLVPGGGSAPDVYLEYIYVNSAFEYIGTTQADLSQYMKKTDMVAITNSEIDALIGA